MRAAYSKYQDQGFEVLSVSVQESQDAIDGFIDRYGLTYPFLSDTTGEISGIYDVTTTPTTYFIAPDGTIVDTISGVVNQGWLERNISEYITS